MLAMAIPPDEKPSLASERRKIHAPQFCHDRNLKAAAFVFLYVSVPVGGQAALKGLSVWKISTRCA
jgi:hypothetical protein